MGAELLADLGFGASLKIADSDSLPLVGLQAVALWGAVPLQTVAPGLVTAVPATASLFFGGELEGVGLRSETRDRWAGDGVLTGSDGVRSFNGFDGDVVADLGGAHDAFRRLAFIAEAGRLGGPMGLTAVEVNLCLLGGGDSESWESVSIVRSDNDGRGFRFPALDKSAVSSFNVAASSESSTKQFSSSPGHSRIAPWAGGVESRTCKLWSVVAPCGSRMSTGLVGVCTRLAFNAGCDRDGLLVPSPSGRGEIVVGAFVDALRRAGAFVTLFNLGHSGLLLDVLLVG